MVESLDSDIFVYDMEPFGFTDAWDLYVEDVLGVFRFLCGARLLCGYDYD
jgi:hypothetical protein